MESIYSLWPWYIAGPLIGLFVPLLLLVGNRVFGISTAFLHICSLAIPAKKAGFLKYDPAKNSWKFAFVIGIAIGAFISVKFLSPTAVAFLPPAYFTPAGLVQLFVGGLLVGFGTRYADGCTSGHAIAGLSLLNKGSLIATLSFFIGGMAYTFTRTWLF